MLLVLPASRSLPWLEYPRPFGSLVTTYRIAQMPECTRYAYQMAPHSLSAKHECTPAEHHDLSIRCSFVSSPTRHNPSPLLHLIAAQVLLHSGPGLVSCRLRPGLSLSRKQRPSQALDSIFTRREPRRHARTRFPMGRNHARCRRCFANAPL